MTTSKSWSVVCQDPGDGSDDLVVEVPREILEHLGWSLGDQLEIEEVEGSFILKLKQRAVDEGAQ